MKKYLAITILTAAFFFFAGCGSKKEKPVNLPNPKENIQVEYTQKELISADPETADWKTYKNEEHKYSVKYPKEWFFMKDACCPPPPAFVSLNNISENKKEFAKRQMEKSAWNFDISCLYEGNIDEIGEVKSERGEGESGTELKINGFEAVRFTKPIYPGSKDENVITHYIVNGEEGCRIIYSDKCAVCGKILSTFEFSK